MPAAASNLITAVVKLVGLKNRLLLVLHYAGRAFFWLACQRVDLEQPRLRLNRRNLCRLWCVSSILQQSLLHGGAALRHLHLRERASSFCFCIFRVLDRAVGSTLCVLFLHWRIDSNLLMRSAS